MQGIIEVGKIMRQKLRNDKSSKVSDSVVP